MRDGFPKGRRRAAAAAVALAVALAMAPGTGSTPAQANDDEDVPFDTKILRQFLKDLGLQRDGSQIEYRERAPLVVPPSRNLPPPQDAAAAAAGNPAWPNDPDVSKRKADAARKKDRPHRTAAEATEAEARLLSRDELERGRVAAGASRGGPPPKTAEESGRPMQPSELGSKNIFADMFSSFKPGKGETADFPGEPVRESLTAPPPGYQTPSPNQPYGLGPQIAKPPTAARPEDRLTGSR